MARFFEVVPYILALGTIALGAVEIRKNWKEYKSSRLRIAVAVIFMVVGALSMVSLYHDSQEKKETQSKAEGNMKALQGKVDAAKQAQEDNTKLFVESFNKMSGQVSDLQSDIKTEALQKKLNAVRTELQNTQKAIADPGPKAKLIFTFEPFSNPPAPTPPNPAKEVTAQLAMDGSIHVEFRIANPTNVDAADIALNLAICHECKYAKDPTGFIQLSGMENWMRYIHIPTLHALEVSTPISLDIIPPSDAFEVEVGFGYRCHACVLQTGNSPETSGTIHIGKR